MRTITGLDRPAAQWSLVTACVIVTGLLALATGQARRTARHLEESALREREARIERGALDAQLSRERAAREAFAMELDRVRAGQAPARAGQPGALPTLTLTAPATRGTAPPEPTVVAPDPRQIVELRLILPATAGARYRDVEIVARDWSTGRTRWSRADARIDALDGRHAVVAFVSGEMVAPGAYDLAVTAVPERGGATEQLASYELGVGKR